MSGGSVASQERGVPIPWQEQRPTQMALAMVRPLSFSLRTAESRLASANFGGHRFKFGDEWGFCLVTSAGFGFVRW